MRKVRPRLAVTTLSVSGLLGLLAAPPAAAQLDGIRCAGWPGGNGLSGLIVVRPGATCNGALYSDRHRTALLGLRVVEPPHMGSFTVTGLRSFTYSAPANFSGVHAVVLESAWQNGSKITHRRFRMRIVSEAGYHAAGGTEAAPPASMATARGRR